MSPFWISVLVVAGLIAALVWLVELPAARAQWAAATWAQRQGRGQPVASREYRGHQRSFASALARQALASEPQAYRQVRHASERWMREVGNLHMTCSERCLQQVASYCRTHPDTARVQVRFRLLDPTPLPRDYARGQVVFRCPSTSRLRLCHSACLCDVTDEICPTGYHLQIGAAPPDAPEDSPPQMEWGEMCLRLPVLEAELFHPSWERLDWRERGVLRESQLALAGSRKTRYCYKWSD